MQQALLLTILYDSYSEVAPAVRETVTSDRFSTMASGVGSAEVKALVCPFVMNKLPQNCSSQIASASLSRPWKFPGFLDGESIGRFTSVAMVMAWAPPALFSGFRVRSVFFSFLTDYAYQTRFLIILPALILAAPSVSKRLDKVARQIEEFVPEYQLPDFETNWASFKRLRNSIVSRVVIVLLTYALFVELAQYVSPQGGEIFAWWKSGAGFGWFSIAGTWALFVSYPILVYFTLLWLWNQFLWTRFMRATARLDVRLTAGHPDNLRCIAFLVSELRGQRPFGLCLGLGFIGAVANRVLHDGESLADFSHVAAVFVAAVLLICVTPYLAFSPVLMRMRRGGLPKYGAFARTAIAGIDKASRIPRKARM
jgi:hypothetical protein